MPFVKKYNDTLTKFDPPAPVLEIFLSSPGVAVVPPTPVEALIDSGADITAIPRMFVEQLQLKLVDQVPDAFIGRDLINSWELFLHGKASVFEIS
jgi:hypothetical protein